jgi:hypothetical protein
VILPSSAGAEIGPEENSEAAGPIFNTNWVQRYDRRVDKSATHAPSRAFFFARTMTKNKFARFAKTGLTGHNRCQGFILSEAFGRDACESGLSYGKAVSSHGTP